MPNKCDSKDAQNKKAYSMFIVFKYPGANHWQNI